MNLWRVIVVLLEIFLLGLGARLIVFSYRHRHYDSILAEVSYGMFVIYAILNGGNNLDHGVSYFLVLAAIASLVGIAGLAGIVRSLDRSVGPLRVGEGDVTGASETM